MHFVVTISFFPIGWPTNATKKDIEDLSFGLVPKPPKEPAMRDRDIAWRCSFNRGEKMLLLESQPSIANNCRRPVLRILKSLRKDYHWTAIKSYHLKTVMMHEFESHNPREWRSENIFQCLRNALERLRGSLSSGKCQHYFLSSVNLFEQLRYEDRLKVIQDINNFLRDPRSALDKLNGQETPSKNSELLFFFLFRIKSLQ